MQDYARSRQAFHAVDHILYLDRVNMATVTPEWAADLKLTNIEFGTAIFAFLPLHQTARAKKPTREADRCVQADRSTAPSAAHTKHSIFFSLEFSLSTWLTTSLALGNGETMSKFTLGARDVPGRLDWFAEVQRKAEVLPGPRYGFVVIQETGLDGVWRHQKLEADGIETYLLDPPSIAVSSRAHRGKTDRVDGEMLVQICSPICA